MITRHGRSAVNGGSGNGNKHMFTSARQWRDWPPVFNWASGMATTDQRNGSRLHIRSGARNGAFGTRSQRYRWARGLRLQLVGEFQPTANVLAWSACGNLSRRAGITTTECSSCPVADGDRPAGLDQNDRKIGDEVWSSFFSKLGAAALSARARTTSGFRNRSAEKFYPWLCSKSKPKQNQESEIRTQRCGLRGFKPRFGF